MGPDQARNWNKCRNEESIGTPENKWKVILVNVVVVFGRVREKDLT